MLNKKFSEHNKIRVHCPLMSPFGYGPATLLLLYMHSQKRRWTAVTMTLWLSIFTLE